MTLNYYIGLLLLLLVYYGSSCQPVTQFIIIVTLSHTDNLVAYTEYRT